MKFKNDKERKAFLDDYRNRLNGWFNWKSDIDLERRWWRLELTDDIAFVVEEEHQTFAFPEHHDAWTARQWYITDQKIAEYACGDRKPHFGDYKASKSQALQYLKACEKGEL